MQRSEKSAGQSAALPASKAPNRYAAPTTGRPTPGTGLVHQSERDTASSRRCAADFAIIRRGLESESAFASPVSLYVAPGRGSIKAEPRAAFWPFGELSTAQVQDRQRFEAAAREGRLSGPPTSPPDDSAGSDVEADHV
jgi:hypothetical protein